MVKISIEWPRHTPPHGRNRGVLDVNNFLGYPSSSSHWMIQADLNPSAVPLSWRGQRASLSVLSANNEEGLVFFRRRRLFFFSRTTNFGVASSNRSSRLGVAPYVNWTDWFWFLFYLRGPNTVPNNTFFDDEEQATTTAIFSLTEQRWCGVGLWFGSDSVARQRTAKASMLVLPFVFLNDDWFFLRDWITMRHFLHSLPLKRRSSTTVFGRFQSFRRIRTPKKSFVLHKR